MEDGLSTYISTSLSTFYDVFIINTFDYNKNISYTIYIGYYIVIINFLSEYHLTVEQLERIHGINR